MSGASRFLFKLIMVPLLFQTQIAFAERPMTESEFAAFLKSVTDKIDSRTTELTTANGGVRSLELQERKLSRELRDVDRRVRTIEAMGNRSDDRFSIAKEYVYSQLDGLLFGCFAYRAATRNHPREMDLHLNRPIDARLESAICGAMDVATVLIPLGLARMNPTMRTVIDDAFSRRRPQVLLENGKIVSRVNAFKYPRSVQLLRAAAWGVGGLMVVQQTLALTYADEIDYRDAVGRLSPAQVTFELQNQLKRANAVTIELAATRAARLQLALAQSQVQ